MGEVFNKRLEEISKMKIYSKRKQRALDDLATAYLQDGKPLDEGLHEVNKLKKALRLTGYSSQQIEDYLIEYSYISKKSIRKYYHESIYNEDMSISSHVENIPAFYTEQCLTDIIIDELKIRPALLKALRKGASRESLAITYKINNSTLLQNFYEKYKDIIND